MNKWWELNLTDRRIQFGKKKGKKVNNVKYYVTLLRYKKSVNNSVKRLPTTPTPGFCSVQSGIPLFSCTVRKRQGQIFKGVVLKTPNLLCEETVILLEQHRIYQVIVCMLSHFSCVWLCGPMDCSLAGLSIHGILQVRILGWVAMPSCRGFSWPTGQTLASYVSGIARWILYH